MKIISLLCALFPVLGMSQVLIYSPNRKLDRTVDKTYYNTEFIYVQNIAASALSVNFELVENTLLSEWNASICTNRQCFNNVPKTGSFGSIGSDKDGYISFNFSANETPGEGQVRFLITSIEDQSVNDTSHL